MRLRDQVALTLPSFFLRLILGVTFLWAGTGKLVGTSSVVGDDAARLANIGIMPTTPPLPSPAPSDSSDQAPESGEPDEPSESGESTGPASTEPTAPAEPDKPADLDEQANEIIELIEDQLESADKPSLQTDDQPEQTNQPQVRLQSVQYADTVYSASDFPEPMQVKQLYSIALMISKAADPGLTPDSNPIDPIMPAMLASKPWPKVLAWVVAITELVAGAFLILGFLTRISALGTLGIMLVALWMTQFGPAVIQSNNAFFGFIPFAANPWSPGAYTHLLWQLALVAMSGAVFFLGSGAIGVDRLLFRPSPRDPYLHGDPKAGRAKAQHATPTPDRSEFDRTPNPTP